jgi:uncharacterized OB-fold protein
MLPSPALDDVPSIHYWAAVSESRLELQQCHDCRRWLYPPSTTCPYCGFDLENASELGFRPVSGRGVLYSFAIVDTVPPRPPGQDDPFIVALIELDEAPGARIFANLLEEPTSEIAVGAPVEVVFELRANRVLPQFRRIASRPNREGGCESGPFRFPALGIQATD